MNRSDGQFVALDGRFVARQSVGQRDYQEDDYGFDDPMFLLADGMGGHVGGATASGIVVKTFVESYQRASRPIFGSPARVSPGGK